MKYTVKDLMEHKTHEDGDVLHIEIDGHNVAIFRTCSYAGSSRGNYFTLLVDGHAVASRCRFDVAIRKACDTLNQQ